MLAIANAYAVTIVIEPSWLNQILTALNGIGVAMGALLFLYSVSHQDGGAR